jgi:hypothetical protein
VEIGGKSATTDNAGYYVVSNVLPNGDTDGSNYKASFYKSGYTAWQDESGLRVEPKEYLTTDPFLEKQVLYKMEEYFNTWLTQTYGNGTKLAQGTASGSIDTSAGTSNFTTSTFWGTINDAGDIVGGSIQGTFATGTHAGRPFAATILSGNINLGGITLSGTVTMAMPPDLEIENNNITISLESVTSSSAGGNWTYAGGVYINDETGTAVQVTSDPKNPEVPKFDLKPLDYLYYYGQSLETVYLYPTNSTITGKILVFHNNTEPPEGVPDVKIEFSNVRNPALGDHLYTATINTGAILETIEASPITITVTSGTFRGTYDSILNRISGTVTGLVSTSPFSSFTGTVSGSPTDVSFSGALNEGTAIRETGTGITISGPFTPEPNSAQIGRFYGEGKTDKNGEFTVTGVPAGQALYIQIPGFTDKAGRYYSGDNPFAVIGTNWDTSYSAGPFITQRNASVALPTIYLKADADIALITGTSLGTPNERLEIDSELVVTFSKTMDTKTFSATFTPAAGSKGGGTINLIAEWAPTGEGKDELPDTQVTLTPNNVKMPGYSDSGILPYWNGSATDLYTGVLTFGTSTTRARALDGSILIDPITADVPTLPVFTEVGLILESVKIISATESAAAGARSLLQQGGEVILTFNKEVAETDGTRFVIVDGGYEYPQAWKIDTDEKIIHVFNDRPIVGTAYLRTLDDFPVYGKGDKINDLIDIGDDMIRGLASFIPDTEYLSIIKNPYLEKAIATDQDKLNGEKIATNIKIGAANTGWNPLEPIVLEFSQGITAYPSVDILYQSAPNEYRVAATITAAAVDGFARAIRIPIAAANRLLAPGKTYYLSFTVTPQSGTPAKTLVVNPRLETVSANQDKGLNVYFTIEDEDATKFAILDNSVGGNTNNGAITLNTTPTVLTWWPNVTIQGPLYTAVTSRDVPRTINLYRAQYASGTIAAWTPVPGGDFTIDAGATAAVSPYTITLDPSDGPFSLMYRGISADGVVISTIATVSVPSTSVTITTTNTDNISGVMGELMPRQFVGIQLAGDTFSNPTTPASPVAYDVGTVVTDWFPELEDSGLSAEISKQVNINTTAAEIAIYGTPTKTITATNLTVIVPQGATKVGVPLKYTTTGGTAQQIAISAFVMPEVAVTPTSNIGGRVNEALAPVNLNVNLTGDTFKTTFATTANLDGWFKNLPADLHARPALTIASGSAYAIIQIYGTPSKASNDPFEIVIPGTALNKGITTRQTVASYAITPITGTISVTAGTNVPAASTVIGAPITEYMTLQISTGAYFKGLGENEPVDSWFTNRPAGLYFKVARKIDVTDEEDEVEIKITGASSNVLSSQIQIVVPGDKTTVGNSIAVNTGLGNYQFTAPTASITAHTSPFSGTVSVAIGTESIQITLGGSNYFNPTLVNADLSSWVQNLPTGTGTLKALNQTTITGSTTQVITLYFDGQPGLASNERIQITIPANATTSGKEIKIALSSSYVFDIN